MDVLMPNEKDLNIFLNKIVEFIPDRDGIARGICLYIIISRLLFPFYNLV
jgi:hypothetical protein